MTNDPDQWLYLDAEGNQVGPVSPEELQALAASGIIHAETGVWKEGLEEWATAAQVEGLIPVAATAPVEETQAATPTHTPQINLGPSTGIHLESTIEAKPMGGSPLSSASLLTPYSQPKKSPVVKIIVGIILVLAIGGGIYFATQTEEDEKIPDTPGLTAYTKANDILTTSKNNDIHANNDTAITIAKKFSDILQQQLDPNTPKNEAGEVVQKIAKKKKADDDDDFLDDNESDDEDVSEDKTAAKSPDTFPAFCLTKTEITQNAVVILVKVPNLSSMKEPDTTKLIGNAWVSARLALKETPYDQPKTNLIVAIRGKDTYHTILVGHPLPRNSPKTAKKSTAPATPPKLNLQKGVDKTYPGTKAKEILPPYFANPKNT